MTRYDFKNLHVLVVDDCSLMQKVVEKILNVLGVEHVKRASDGYDAIEKLRRFDADIVICDWEMSPMDGPGFMHYLRLDPDSPAPYVPVIFLSGHTEQERIEQARDLGITEFLAKPVSAKTLYKRLVSIVERPRVFVRTDEFFGPCRRRLNLPRQGRERRISQAVEQPAIRHISL